MPTVQTFTNELHWTVTTTRCKEQDLLQQPMSRVKGTLVWTAFSSSASGNASTAMDRMKLETHEDRMSPTRMSSNRFPNMNVPLIPFCGHVTLSSGLTLINVASYRPFGQIGVGECAFNIGTRDSAGRRSKDTIFACRHRQKNYGEVSPRI